MDLIDLNKLHIESKYVKPKLSPIDIDIINDNIVVFNKIFLNFRIKKHLLTLIILEL